MSRRKFKKGPAVKSLDELMKYENFILHGKTYCSGWVRSWQLNMANNYIRRGELFIAERLTNEEYYDGKSDEQLKDMIGEEVLCDYCPLDESKRGVHCYGGQPIMCEGTHYDEALEAWKEEYVI